VAGEERDRIKRMAELRTMLERRMRERETEHYRAFSLQRACC